MPSFFSFDNVQEGTKEQEEEGRKWVILLGLGFSKIEMIL